MHENSFPTAIFGNFHKISMAPRIFSILTESLNIQYHKYINQFKQNKQKKQHLEQKTEKTMFC